MIVLYLATEKGYNVLKCLVSKDKLNLVQCIVVGTDNNVHKDFSEEIINTCVNYNIKYFINNLPKNFKTEYSLAISWRRLINQEKSKLIVLHDSLLPKYRGFAPLVNQLINGDNKIGVTALFATDNYDQGDIILQSSISIEYPIKINEAIKLISRCYEDLVLKIFEILFNNKSIITLKQDDNKATYSLWRDDQDYRIKWNQSAEEIKRFIDAVGFPYKGANSFLNGRLVTISDAQVVEDVNIINRDIGKIIFVKDNFPVIVCGKGLLLLKELKDESGNNLLPLNKFRLRFN